MRTATKKRRTAKKLVWKTQPLVPRRISGFPSPELKAVDTAAAMVVDSTGEVDLISGIARGDGLGERIGRRVTLKSLLIRWRSDTTVSSGVEQCGRVLIVYDKQTNGAAPAVTDVITSASALSPMNLSNSGRFKVLYDKFYTLPNYTGTEFKMEIGDVYRKLNLPMFFNAGDAGTVADITTGAVFIISVGTVAAGATAATLTYSARLRYVDN